MNCRLPQSYVDALPARIVEARRQMLLAMLPQGVSGGGSDNWWDGARVTHDDGTSHRFSGNRWHAESTPAWGGMTESGRTLTVTFTVTNTAVDIGEDYPCEHCNSTT